MRERLGSLLLANVILTEITSRSVSLGDEDASVRLEMALLTSRSSSLLRCHSSRADALGSNAG